MQTITPTALADTMQTRDPEAHIIVDVRLIGEYTKGHIPGALHIPAKRLTAELATIKSFPHVYLYGATDHETARACLTLTTVGIHTSIHILGGYRQWAEKIGRIETAKKSMSLSQQAYVFGGSLGLLGIILGLLVSWYFCSLSIAVFVLFVMSGTSKTNLVERFFAALPRNQPAPHRYQTAWWFAHDTIMVKTFRNALTGALSYAILSDHQILLVDPWRDSSPYLAFAKKHEADIKGIVFTHVHEDMIMGHTELLTAIPTKIYLPASFPVSRPYTIVTPGEIIYIGEARVVLQTVGSQGSFETLEQEKMLRERFCSRHLQDQAGQGLASFIGDMLDIQHPMRLCSFLEATQVEVAPATVFGQSVSDVKKQRTARDYLFPLLTGMNHGKTETCLSQRIFPTHRLHTFLTPGVTDHDSITLGDLRYIKSSVLHLEPALAIPLLTKQQVPPPRSRASIAASNCEDILPLAQTMKSISYLYTFQPLQQATYQVIDTRPALEYSKYMIASGINIPFGPQFFALLCQLHDPREPWYCIAQNKPQALHIIEQLVLGGYEKSLKAILLIDEQARHQYSFPLDPTEKTKPDCVIIDVRTADEVVQTPIFAHAFRCPLGQLPEKLLTLPRDKPLCVYASDQLTAATAHSLLKKAQPLARVYVADDALLARI